MERTPRSLQEQFADPAARERHALEHRNAALLQEYAGNLTRIAKLAAIEVAVGRAPVLALVHRGPRAEPGAMVVPAGEDLDIPEFIRAWAARD